MNIVIVGAGKVGYALAKYLSIEGDNVTIIDNNIAALERINNSLDVMCVKGNCTSLKVLNEAGVKDADLLISVTNSDELNMLCSLAAKKLGTKYTISRVRNPEYDEDITLLSDAVGIDLVINPEKAAANEIAKLIKFPSVCSIDDFSEGKVNLIGFKITPNTDLVGKRISELGSIRGNILFCGVERNDAVIIPKGDYVFQVDDRIYVIGEHKEIQDFFKRLGKYEKRVKNSMIIGGGKISYYLAKKINDVGVSCKIIEKNIKKCEELTELLPDSIIINGDGMDQQLLMSENLGEVNNFIALTDRDEDNIVAALFAANKSVNNIITKVTRENHITIAESVGINSIVSPKLATANKIIKYVRSLKGQRKYLIENMYMICNEKVEAIEFIVDENTKNLNKKFKDLTISDDIIYATIVRDDKIIIPTGDDCLKINDKVIVVSQNKKFEEIIFGGDK